MERSHLVDGYLRNQQPQPLPWLHRQSLGLSNDQGGRLEDLFSRMDLGVGGENNNNNLVPRFDDGVYGTNVGVGVNSFNIVNNNNQLLLYGNGYSNPSVGSPYVSSTVHGNLETCYNNQSQMLYQTELQRIQMIEFWRRHNAVAAASTNLPAQLGFSVSPYSSRNEFHSSSAAALRRSHRANGNTNVSGLSPVSGMCNNEINLMDFRGRIFQLATDQLGCKMLQIKLGEIKDEEVEMILNELVDNVSSLMMDQFGNYLVQRLIVVCSEEQRTRIVRSVTKNPYQLIHICLNLHGTRAVQKLLESLTTDQQISTVISAISPGVVALIKDANAYHVIQHCLNHFSDEHTQFLVNEISHNCYEIATNKSGCCVLQLCVDITKGQVNDHLISEIVSIALPLSEDRYGNYVVQHLLLMKLPNVTAKVVNELQSHFFPLACNKYGSNVVEKCLTETGKECSDLVIIELLRTPNVTKLLQDPFGNYVFQSALSVSQGILHNALVTIVEKNAASMSSNLYGKKILAWFENRKRICHIYGNIRS